MANERDVGVVYDGRFDPENDGDTPSSEITEIDLIDYNVYPILREIVSILTGLDRAHIFLGHYSMISPFENQEYKNSCMLRYKSIKLPMMSASIDKDGNEAVLREIVYNALFVDCPISASRLQTGLQASALGLMKKIEDTLEEKEMDFKGQIFVRRLPDIDTRGAYPIVKYEISLLGYTRFKLADEFKDRPYKHVLFGTNLS